MNSKDKIRVLAREASQNDATLHSGLSILLLVGLIIVLVLSIKNMSGI